MAGLNKEKKNMTLSRIRYVKSTAATSPTKEHVPYKRTNNTRTAALEWILLKSTGSINRLYWYLERNRKKLAAIECDRNAGTVNKTEIKVDSRTAKTIMLINSEQD